ncbi:hypothetical protein N7454_001156 [Penicillium verhagenii]|nr:hypothetical protein N7454_001156 [Penicillium verhagenii]
MYLEGTLQEFLYLLDIGIGSCSHGHECIRTNRQSQRQLLARTEALTPYGIKNNLASLLGIARLSPILGMKAKPDDSSYSGRR